MSESQTGKSMRAIVEVVGRIVGVVLFFHGVYYHFEYVYRLFVHERPYFPFDTFWLAWTSVFLLLLGSLLFAFSGFFAKLIVRNDEHLTLENDALPKFAALSLAFFAIYIFYRSILVVSWVLGDLLGSALDLSFDALVSYSASYKWQWLKLAVLIGFGVFLLRSRHRIVRWALQAEEPPTEDGPKALPRSDRF